MRALHLVDHRRLDVACASGREQLRRDAEDLCDCAVRLLASAPVRVGELDQPRLEQHADMEVQVTGIDAETLRELAVRELPVAFLAEHLEDAHPQRMSRAP